MAKKEIEFHPLANIFPLMPEKLICRLADDIKKNGLQEVITIFEGKILDGRNRYLACRKAEVAPLFKDFKGNNPLAFVLSSNANRQHFNESQRGLVGARLANLPPHRPENKSASMRTYSYTQPEAAKLLNVSERLIQYAKVILEEAPEEVPAIEQGDKTIIQVIREIKRKNIQQKILQAPKGKYRVIYSDPPWRYSDDMVGLDEKGYGVAAERHYPTMSIQELCDLPVKDWADENAVLFLWVTSPMLEACFKVINAWGFEYTTSIVWDKDAHNFGHYVSVRHEFLLICTRGSCLPDTKKLLPSVVKIKRSKTHSEKPERFREMIDEMYCRGQRIELFARNPVPRGNWVYYGNEADLPDGSER
jgi:N6-adenosine-specific RNA methylase IME4